MNVVESIDLEISRLQSARKLLMGGETSPSTIVSVRRGPGRPRLTHKTVASKKPRVLSAEGRARIREAQKKRWAIIKKEKVAA